MNEFRDIASKIDQHMQLLSSKGVTTPDAVVAQMIGYMPDLHKLWVGTSDDELRQLCAEFPRFYRYAELIENGSEAYRIKHGLSSDEAQKFPASERETVKDLLTKAATLERLFLTIQARDGTAVSDSMKDELALCHLQWRSEVTEFWQGLKNRRPDPRVLKIMDEVFGPLVTRLHNLARPFHAERKNRLGGNP